MTAKIIRLPVTHNADWSQRDTPVLESAPFMSMCPTCKDSRSQLGYSARTLVRLLDRNRPIEACCAICNQSWPIDAQERRRLAEELEHLRLT
jgi:hypothetical protein